MTDEVTRRLERRNAELSRIKESLERWHRKLTRAVNAIDKLRAEEKRLLKPWGLIFITAGAGVDFPP